MARHGLDNARREAFLEGVLAQLTVLAPGLLGSSVARAAHHRGLAQTIVLWSRRPENRMRLRSQPWCQAVRDTPEEAVRGASVIVLAAPVEKIITLAQAIGPHLGPGTLVTDVGSVKGEITRLCHAAMPAGAHFVGAHPMAGSEKSGWEHATDTLFEGRTCFVTPRPETHPGAVEAVVHFWHDLGAEVTTLDPDLHDEIVAHISHLPQVVAANLCHFLARKNPAWRNFAGGGLRDTTRIGAGDPTMWVEILKQNREEVLRALRQFQDELHGFQTALANGDFAEIRARLEQSKAYRDGFRP
ncbi:MAG TPA: prephenate dehydrogenase/arogenate dehydrogenase family protein [Opitutaceae bacterium]|nr:prephenate dehydrogenase/arogenate dehydrogenase family protein [Opitutaceae bacterium]